MKILLDFLRECLQDRTSKAIAEDIVKRYNPKQNAESIRRGVSLIREIAEREGVKMDSELFYTTNRKLNKDGEVTSESQRLYTSKTVAPADHNILQTSIRMPDGSWVKTKKGGYQINHKDLTEDVEKIFKELGDIPAYVPSIVKTHDKPLVLVFTDTHIGMETDKDGVTNYKRDWNEKIVRSVPKQMVAAVAKKLASEDYSKIVIMDLGDFLDGMDGLTTRGGHDLPQNMNNREAFRCAVDFKNELLKNMQQFGLPIELHNVCNDNHSGDFGYYVNETVKMVNKGVEVVNCIQNFNHTIQGEYCIIYTHGKNKDTQKRPMPRHMNSDTFTKLIQYADEHKLHNYKLMLFKGDGHVYSPDFQNTKISYVQFPALSPPSSHGKDNYTNLLNGFCLVDLDGQIPTIKFLELDDA